VSWGALGMRRAAGCVLPLTTPHKHNTHTPHPSLLAAGCKGLHMYTLNQEEACFSIMEALDLKLPMVSAEGEEV
jgi:hypothetical protein